jgi:serine/threonine protein kinase
MTVPASKSDFDMISVLGKGPYGTVFKALDKRTNKIVAVKVAPSTAIGFPSSRKSI